MTAAKSDAGNQLALAENVDTGNTETQQATKPYVSDEEKSSIFESAVGEQNELRDSGADGFELDPSELLENQPDILEANKPESVDAHQVSSETPDRAKLTNQTPITSDANTQLAASLSAPAQTYQATETTGNDDNEDSGVPSLFNNGDSVFDGDDKFDPTKITTIEYEEKQESTHFVKRDRPDTPIPTPTAPAIQPIATVNTKNTATTIDDLAGSTSTIMSVETVGEDDDYEIFTGSQYTEKDFEGVGEITLVKTEYQRITKGAFKRLYENEETQGVAKNIYKQIEKAYAKNLKSQDINFDATHDDDIIAMQAQSIADTLTFTYHGKKSKASAELVKSIIKHRVRKDIDETVRKAYRQSVVVDKTYEPTNDEYILGSRAKGLQPTATYFGVKGQTIDDSVAAEALVDWKNEHVVKQREEYVEPVAQEKKSRIPGLGYLVGKGKKIMSWFKREKQPQYQTA